MSLSRKPEPVEDDWQIRCIEVAELASTGGPAAFDRLVELLRHVDTAVRVDAAEALLDGWGEQGLREVLLVAFDGDAQTRGWLWGILHERTDFGPGRIDEWVESLQSSADEHLRVAIEAYRAEPW